MVGPYAQYGCLRYLYTDMMAVTASPQPVTIRLSFPGYDTMSPHA